MIQEEKAKAYDEAIKKAAALYKASEPMSGCNVIIETLFPELKEPEDEKVRKALIEYFNEQCDMSDWNGVYGYQVVSWLEKQGDQKSIWHNEDEEPQRDSLILLIMQSGTPIVAKIIEPNHTFNHGERWAYIDDLLEKQDEQKYVPIEMKSAEESLGVDSETYNKIVDECIFGEQKPAWSEEDERNLQGVIDEIEANKNQAPDYDLATYDRFLSWLKSFKDRVQPKQEWSEEDSVKLQRIIDFLWYNRKGDTDAIYQQEQDIDWLKSLRPKNRWKPSDEQMKALNYVVNLMASSESPKENDYYYNVFKDLRKQLKKLKEGKV